MKAIQAGYHGSYDALRLVDIPRPQPRAGQALVRVTSAGVTPLDRTVLAGLHPRAAAPPLVPGNEGAGIVIEDPSGRFSAGERVLCVGGQRLHMFLRLAQQFPGFGFLTGTKHRHGSIVCGSE